MSNIPRSAHGAPHMPPYSAPYPVGPYITQVSHVPPGMVPLGYAPPPQHAWPYSPYGPSPHHHSIPSTPVTPLSAPLPVTPSVLQPAPSHAASSHVATHESYPSQYDSNRSAPSSRRSSLAPARSSPLHKPTSPSHLSRKDAHKEIERRRSLSNLLGDLADEVASMSEASQPGPSRKLSKTNLIESSTRRLRAYRQAATSHEAELDNLKQENQQLYKHIEALQQQLARAGIAHAQIDVSRMGAGETATRGGTVSPDSSAETHTSHIRRSSMPAHLHGIPPQPDQNGRAWNEASQQQQHSSPEQAQSTASPSLFSSHYSLATSPSMYASHEGAESGSPSSSMQDVSPPSQQQAQNGYLAPSALLDRRFSLPLDLSPLSSLSGQLSSTSEASGHGSVSSFASTPSTATSAATPSSYVHGQALALDHNGALAQVHTFSDPKDVETLLDLMSSLDDGTSGSFQAAVNA